MERFWESAIIFFGIVAILFVILSIILWFTEETKIGRKFSNWALNKILGTHFENLDWLFGGDSIVLLLPLHSRDYTLVR